MNFHDRYAEYHYYKKRGICVTCHAQEAEHNRVRCEYCAGKHRTHCRAHRQGRANAKHALTGLSTTVFQGEREDAPAEIANLETEIKKLQQTLALSRRTCAHYMKLSKGKL